jgi:LysR family transcriptional regulator for bpeEF and oprC
MDRLAAMRLFVRVGELGSFARAAESLGISSATATERVRRLETELNTRLLNRTTRRVALTEEGDRYFRVCQSVIAELSEVERAIGEDGRARRGRVVISLNVGLFRSVILSRLSAFAAMHPQIQLHIVATDARADFVREGIDFAVRIGGLEDQDLIVRRLGAPRRVTVASPDYVRRHGLPRAPDDLSSHRLLEFLLPRVGRTLPWEFEKDSVRREIVFNGTIALSDAEARVRLAEAGAGIAQTVCFLATKPLAEGRLVRLLPEWETDAPPASILYPRHKFIPARVRAAMTFTADAISEELHEAQRVLKRA